METHNIIISGIGGQGVNTLSSTIQKILLKNGKFCKGAIFKGGAQKRGAVYSTIRIFADQETGEHLSSIIPHGELHGLVALEATESLRYAKYFKSTTNLIVNEFSFDFYNERQKGGAKKVDVKSALSSHFENTYLNDYNKQSKELFGDESMVNVLIGLDAIKYKTLQIDTIDFLDEIQKKLNINYEKMMILMDLCNV